jgi:multidrug efflux pump subunit AcrA (membrane-fusion protein)
MRNERGRCGQVRRLLESGRGGVARIAPSLMARRGEEATPLGVWRYRPAPDSSPIGPRAQSVHLSRFAFRWLKADAESSTSEPKGQELVYAAPISLDRTQIQVEENLVSLSPGMAVTVEVKTGSRTVLTYLLSPLLRYKQESLRER